MNINIKDCEVNIITGTETLEIKGKPQSAAPATLAIAATAARAMRTIMFAPAS